jgi:hypothetical protein
MSQSCRRSTRSGQTPKPAPCRPPWPPLLRRVARPRERRADAPVCRGEDTHDEGARTLPERSPADPHDVPGGFEGFFRILAEASRSGDLGEAAYTRASHDCAINWVE